MKEFSLALALALSICAPVSALAAPLQSPPVLNDQQKAVWQGEVNYWKYVNGRDLKDYLTLWHPDFTGWPCEAEHPADIGGIEKFATAWFAQKTKVGEVSTPQVEAVVVDHDFAITYLSTRSEWTDAAGVKQTKLEKFVHTWKATDHGWKIIGGMCAPLTHNPL
jgi:ketosteroid isomerase-like protein